MKLFLLSQDVNYDYDTYDSAIVAAETEEEARMIHPSSFQYTYKDWNGTEEDTWEGWCDAKDVEVEYLGEAKEGIKKGLVIASFNAG